MMPAAGECRKGEKEAVRTGRENTFAIETAALTKMYRNKAAVKNVDLKVREGEIYGFIGRNGAGKSTTLKMLCGLASPTGGEIQLFGTLSEYDGKAECGDESKMYGAYGRAECK